MPKSQIDPAEKAQSALEYLMTYGWAILIIAVVLIAMFSLGLFNPSTSLPGTCIANSGFICSNVTLSSELPQGTDANTLAILKFNLGQETGVTIYNSLVFVSSENYTLIPLFGVQIPEPLAIQNNVNLMPPIAQLPSLSNGQISPVVINMGDTYVYYKGTSQLESYGGLIVSNTLGTGFSGYVWIAYNSSSGTGQRNLIQRLGTMTVKVT